MVNAHREPVEFVVQEGRPSEWQRVVDTARESPDDIREPDRGAPLTSARYTVGPRSAVVLVRPWIMSSVDAGPRFHIRRPPVSYV